MIRFRRYENAASGAEGGGRKEVIFYKIRYYDFGRFFIWPTSQVNVYNRYLELFDDVLDGEIRTLVERHRDFESELDSLQYLGLFSRLIKLIKLSNSEEYKMYRGI